MAQVYITDTGGLDFLPGTELLEEAGHTVISLDLDPAAGPDEAQKVADLAADADALIVSFVEITAETIAALPALKVIATTTRGSNHIDADAAAARDIAVHPLPSLASEEVATHALAGLLAMIRELPTSREVAREDWDFARIPSPPRMSEMVLGVYGMGEIARKVVTRATPLFRKVVGLDPFVSEDAWPEGVERLHDVDELFAISDALSLHVPLTNETLGVVGDRTLALMPRGGYLVNVSRGALIDDRALTAALGSGQLRGAFLDVLETEPPRPDDPLLNRPEIIVTPHSAFYSSATALAYVTTPSQVVINVLEDHQP